MKSRIGLFLGPALFVLIYFLDLQGLSESGKGVLAGTLWVAVWWITEPIPMAATSLLPIVLFPIFGGMDTKVTTTTYYSPIIMLFMGGFIIALAIEKWSLHQRIALNIIRIIGTNAKRIILGFMLATMFLSMWISNSATALMMFPIGLAIANKITDFSEGKNQSGNQQFHKTLMLAVAYAASIGGMSTLIGTPTNSIFSAMTLELFQTEVSFAKWFSLGFPLSFVLVLAGWFYLSFIAFKTTNFNVGSAKDEIRRQLHDLGRISFEEKVVTAVFAFTAVSWITRSFLLNKIIPGINDTIIAIFGALILFVLPSSKKGIPIMDWKTARNLPWGVLLLFGGGLTIATGFKSSGLAVWLGEQLVDLNGLPYFVLLALIIVIVNFSTEITSNVATASVLLPILASVALTIGVHPYGLMAGACLASSCAFMLPVATPPNAIAYSSGYLSIEDMVRIGFWMNIISSIIVLLFVYFALPLIWGIDLFQYPSSF